MKQTVVEFLVEQFEEINTIKRWQQIVEQAKEMEKKQIIDAYCDGRLSVITKEIISYEQYYQKTFK